MRDGRTQAVFFDLDGTLADTAPDLGGALNDLLQALGRPPLPIATLRPHVSAGTRGMLGVGFAITPDAADYPDLAQRFLEHYANRLCRETRLFSGMPILLDHLDQQGIAWGIVTNKPSRFTLPLAACLELNRRAAAIVSGDSTPRPKPAPDSLLLACRQAGVAPGESLYVGDDPRDIQAAKAAGMIAIAAAYGYLGEVPIKQWGADAIITAPVDLLGMLRVSA